MRVHRCIGQDEVSWIALSSREESDGPHGSRNDEKNEMKVFPLTSVSGLHGRAAHRLLNAWFYVKRRWRADGGNWLSRVKER